MSEDAEPRTDRQPDGVEVTPVEHDSPGGGFQIAAAGSSRVLIVKDCNPWNTTANEQVFSDLGVDFTVYGSDQLGDADLGSFDVCLLASTQDQQYYDNLAAHASQIESFVDDGGVLVAHVTDDGWPCTTQWSDSFLPAGVGKVTDYGNDLTIADSSHPIYEGISDATVTDWGYSTHGHLTDLPGDATVLAARDADGSRPTHAEYEYGAGRVLVTMQALEWGYAGSVGSRPEDPGLILANELEYALEGGGSRITAKATVLHYINGQNENVTQGGNPLHSAQMQVFPEGGEFELATDSIDPRLPSSLNLPLEPVIDNWQKGDMTEVLPADLETALEQKQAKYEDEFGDVAFNRYRFRNEVEVSLSSTDGETIEEDSVEIRFPEPGSGDDILTFGDDPMSFTVLVEDDINNLKVDEWFGKYRERGTRVGRDYTIQQTEVDGVEAVRVSTVTAGHAGFAHDIVDQATPNVIHFIAEIFGWYDAIADVLPDVPDWIPDPDDIPNPLDRLRDVSWDDLPDPRDWGPDVSWDDIPDLPDRDDLPDTPEWDDLPDPREWAEDVSWDDVPSFPDVDDLDDVIDVPDRPGWDDLPDAPDVPDPDCEDIPGVDDCPDLPGPLAMASGTQTIEQTAGASTDASTQVVHDDLREAAEEIVDLIAPYLPDQFERLKDLITLVPNIYSFTDLYVLADGRRFVRLWDASRFPSLGAYVDGQRELVGTVPYSPRERLNPRLIAFFVMAGAGVTPYTGIDRPEDYLRWVEGQEAADDIEEEVRDFIDDFPGVDPAVGDVIADTPWWTAGYTGNLQRGGEPIPNPEDYVDDNVPDPF